MRRYIVALLILFTSIPFPSQVQAANSDIFAAQGGGTYNNVDVFRIDQSANVLISSFNASNYTAVPHTSISNQGVLVSSGNWIHLGLSDTFFGSPTAAVSTTTTSGTGQGDIFTAFLASGPASGSGISISAVEGSLICSTTSQQGNLVTVVVCPAGAALTNWIGIAASAASTGTVVNVYDSGWILALTTGTVNAGDVLVSTTGASGFLSVQNAPTTGTDVAVALGSGPVGGGLTRVRLR